MSQRLQPSIPTQAARFLVGENVLLLDYQLSKFGLTEDTGERQLSREVGRWLLELSERIGCISSSLRVEAM